MADIVISEFMDEAAVASLKEGFSVHYDKALVDKPAELAALVAPARALIVRNRTQVRGALLEAGRALTVVGRLGVGLDNIDLPACADRQITVIPATGANDVAVAEWTIATILMLLRGAYGASAEIIGGAWPRERLVGREISGKTLGLIGFGAIAREVALRATAMGMRLVAHDPFIGDDDAVWRRCKTAPMAIERLLAEADAVSLHVPLTSETRHLIDASRLARMKPGAILVNAARGGVVDETALAEALKAGSLAAAALDVFEKEPLGAGSPLAGAPNLIVTPHIAGVTVESNIRVSELIARKVCAVLTT